MWMKENMYLTICTAVREKDVDGITVVFEIVPWICVLGTLRSITNSEFEYSRFRVGDFNLFHLIY